MNKTGFFKAFALVLAIGLLSFARVTLAQETVIYSEGFEASNGNYSLDESNSVLWQWGVPTVVGPAACNTGVGCWGTKLDGNAPASSDSSVYSPAIALPSLTAKQVARVKFYAYSDVNMRARGQFLVSSDGTTWKDLADFYRDMRGGWHKYEFNISDYANGNLYLKFRLNSSGGGSPGLYIDDVAVTIYDFSGDSKILTMEATEDSSNASCPWVYTWNGSEFVKDNDIYSVARNKSGEYTDYYSLQQSLVARDGKYDLQIKETEQEESWTDSVALKAVDHAADVKIGNDANGNIFAYKPTELIMPVTAVDNNSNDVLGLVGSKDDNGAKIYADDYVDLDFGNVDATNTPRLILRVKGFQLGEGISRPYTGAPAVTVSVQDGGGAWQELGRLNPRFDWAEGVFDLSSLLTNVDGKVKVRLSSISHGQKYHLVDYAALALGAEGEKIITDLSMSDATLAGEDVKDKLSLVDGNYVNMNTSDDFKVSFTATEQGDYIRDFVLQSRGYYIPDGTYFIHAWDGTDWVLVDGYTFAYPEDETKTFDLSLYSPDPDGEYKIRIWQDFMSGYGDAAIDYLSMSVGEQVGTMSYARDLRYEEGSGPNEGLISQVSASDDSRYNIDSYDTSGRNRWSEFRWTGLPANNPPTATTTVSGDTISWVYNDINQEPQAMAEVQVWTGPGGTDQIIWNPSVINGTDSSIQYAGQPLSNGVTYYARVKANDGVSWGQWNEKAFVYISAPSNLRSTAISSDSVALAWDPISVNSESVLYFVKNVTKDTNSDWISDLAWRSSGLSCGNNYSFQVKAKIGDGSESAFSEAIMVSTSGCGGGASFIPSPCLSVDYDEWQTNCVNDVQFRDIKSLNPSGCKITQAQREATQRTCRQVLGEKESSGEQIPPNSLISPTGGQSGGQASDLKVWPNGSLLKAPDMKIWLIVNGKRFHIINLRQLWRYRGRVIYKVSAETIAQYPILFKL